MNGRRRWTGPLEQISAAIGSGRFIALQTLMLAGWLLTNLVLQVWYQLSHRGCLTVSLGTVHYARLARCAGGPRPADPFPFAFCTLALSVQAAYAAPLILIAQNADIDRRTLGEVATSAESAQSRVTLQYLQRELAAIRVGLGEALTREDVRRGVEPLDHRVT